VSLRRLLAVFQLDFAFQIRRPLFWFLIILSLLLAFGLSIGDVSIRTGDRSVGGKRAFMTSEFAVTQALVLEVFLLYVFFITIAAGMSLIRDGELKIMDLLGSSSLRASEYTWGKYAASAGMTLAALTATVFFSALFNHNMPRSDAEEVRGAFVLSHYLRPVVFMILPFLVFLTGTAFAIGGLLRRPIVIFCLPVAILAFCAFFLWQYSPTWLDPRINDALGLVDPSGFRWLNETFLKNDRGTEYYNYQPVAYSGAFIASRLVYVAVGLASVAFCAYRFRRSLRGTPGTTPAPAKPAMPSTDRSQAVARPDRTPVPAVSRPGFFASAWRVAAVECAALLRQPGMYLFIPLILIQTLAHATFTQGAFETELILTSGGMAARSANFLTFLGCLLLLFYTVESFERDRYCGFAPLLHSSPVATGSVLMGKAWANSLVAVIMLACAWIASIVILAIQNQAPIEVAPFALLWGAILLPTFVLWTSFVTAVDALTRNRFASYAIALAALAGTGWLSIRGDMCWAWNWPLWGALVWSDIGNFEVDRKVLILNRVAAILAAAFFIYIATRRAPRADRDAVRTMQRLSGRPFWIGSLKTVCAALPAVVVVLWTWGEVRAGSQGTLTLRKIEDYWKKNVATWVNEPQPDLARVDLTLELDPPARAFHSVGSFELINSKTTPLQRFALTAGPHWNLAGLCKTKNVIDLYRYMIK
jgi:ABC-type transport system involved in multi-copper enzyme maturation permease subunit